VSPFDPPVESAIVTARAPARVSFGGGGTDLAAYYARFGGFVVSAAITRYAHVVARPTPDGMTRIHSLDYGISETLPPSAYHDIAPPLELPKAVMAWFVERDLLSDGIELRLAAEAPPGAGLGSSSAMAVAVARALADCCGLRLTANAVAELACWAEIDCLGMPIGKQDQYASAYGGVNTLTFAPDSVQVEPVQLPPGVLERLDERLLLFSTGQTRHSSDVLRGQQADTLTNQSVLSGLHRLKELAYEMTAALRAGELDAFGTLLDCGWQAKRRLSSRVSTSAIDAWYAAARAAGALGGKLTGAGGGGFLLFYCPPERQTHLRAAMRAHGLAETPFSFDHAGATTLQAAHGARAATP
jgi:D-glycero-alpha-D-manno-heptose-7-phosphate kinase